MLKLQAGQLRVYNCSLSPPPAQGKHYNGVKEPLYAPDKANLPILNARFPMLLVGTHILACCVLNAFSNSSTVAHAVCLCVCATEQINSFHHGEKGMAEEEILFS